MTEYLTVIDVVELHAEIIEKTGGSSGLRDPGGLDAAVANPSRSFSGKDLYPTIPEKAAILLWSLVQSHPFIDGNKRIGYGAAELSLRLNGKTITAPIDEAEEVVLAVAAGQSTRESLYDWLKTHIVDFPGARPVAT